VIEPDWIRHGEYLAKRYGGFVYPWRSKVDAGNGEDAYSALVREHLRPEIDVIEAGCGHGTDALTFGPQVRSYCGYDAVEAFINVARRRGSETGLKNVTFLVADSSPKRAGRVPIVDRGADLIISRRGPSNFILDAPRVGRPGAVLLQVCYLPPPPPEWNKDLPPYLRVRHEADTAIDKVHAYLERADLRLHSSSLHDVHEHFDDPAELLTRLKWDRGIDVDEAADLDVISAMFRKGSVDGRLSLRHRRFVWKVVLR
jgi:SAM-dependent methyltransferase